MDKINNLSKEEFLSWICAEIDSKLESLSKLSTLTKSYLNSNTTQSESVNVKSLAEKSGKSTSIIYRYAQELGRLPTLDELNSKVRGRRKKY